MSNKQPGQVHQEHTPQRGQERGHVHQVQERERHDRDHLGHETHQARKIDPNEQHGQQHGVHAAKEMDGITVYVDLKPYHVGKTEFTGAELRKLTTPPIGADKNIFRVVSGKDDDVKIADTDVITVNMREAHHGRHFFSDTIVPSKDAVARRAYYLYLEHGAKPGHDVEDWVKAESEIKAHHKK